MEDPLSSLLLAAGIILPVSWLLVCLAASQWIAEKLSRNRQAVWLREKMGVVGRGRKQSQGEGLLQEGSAVGLREVVVELQ